jgi:hypothetical protein
LKSTSADRHQAVCRFFGAGVSNTGMQIANGQGMRQGSFAMEMAKLVGEAEAGRRKERRVRRRHLFFGQIRSVFAFLFVATVFVYAFCKEQEFQNFIMAELDGLSQAAVKSDSFRQTALNHEKEVNEVVK